IALIGFSMGGGEVARYVGKHGSERVSKAGFFSAITPFLLKTPDNPTGADRQLFEGLKKAVLADRQAFLTDFLANFYNLDQYQGKLVSPQVVQDSWNIGVGASPRGTLDCVDAWLTDFRKDLDSFGIPTLVIHGDADRICPFPATGPLTHQHVKGSRLVVIEGGPHGNIWTHADKVNKALIEFLGEGAHSKATGN
ncbi:MAG TPA: alpha/beta hydrolase, partial [Blastocatellia bacterium]